MIEFINSHPEPEVAWCLTGLLALLVLGAVFQVVGSIANRGRMSPEDERTIAYNGLIQVEIAWQEGSVSDEEYQRVRKEFYSQYPGGDVSL